MTVGDAFELATNAIFRELSNFATPPRAGRITALEGSGQVRVDTDDPDGGDVLAWPLDVFEYAVDQVVYVQFGVNSPDSAIVVGSKGSVLPKLRADWDIGEDRRVLTEAIRARDGEGLRLEDDAGNLGVFIEDGGFVGFGTAAPDFLGHFASSVLARVAVDQLSVDATAPGFNYRKARGAGATVNNGDFIGLFSYQPHDGTGYIRAASIHAIVNGAVSTGVTPVDLVFTAGSGDDPGLANKRMWIHATGRVGVGAAATLAQFAIEQALTSGNALRAYRNLTATSTDAPLVDFIQDHASDDQVLLRGQQDGTGDILNLFDGATEVLTLLDGGNFGLNVAAPQGRFHAFDGTGGGLLVTKTGVAGTSVVMIPNATGDVTRCVYMTGVIRDSGGTRYTVAQRIDNGGSQNYDDGGGNRLTITVNANGELSAARALGTLTYDFTIWCVWQ